MPSLPRHPVEENLVSPRVEFAEKSHRGSLDMTRQRPLAEVVVRSETVDCGRETSRQNLGRSRFPSTELGMRLLFAQAVAVGWRCRSSRLAEVLSIGNLCDPFWRVLSSIEP